VRDFLRCRLLNNILDLVVDSAVGDLILNMNVALGVLLHCHHGTHLVGLA